MLKRAVVFIGIIISTSGLMACSNRDDPQAQRDHRADRELEYSNEKFIAHDVNINLDDYKDLKARAIVRALNAGPEIYDGVLSFHRPVSTKYDSDELLASDLTWEWDYPLDQRGWSNSPQIVSEFLLFSLLESRGFIDLIDEQLNKQNFVKINDAEFGRKSFEIKNDRVHLRLNLPLIKITGIDEESISPTSTYTCEGIVVRANLKLVPASSMGSIWLGSISDHFPYIFACLVGDEENVEVEKYFFGEASIIEGR